MVPVEQFWLEGQEYCCRSGFRALWPRTLRNSLRQLACSWLDASADGEAELSIRRRQRPEGLAEHARIRDHAFIDHERAEVVSRLGSVLLGVFVGEVL